MPTTASAAGVRHPPAPPHGPLRPSLPRLPPIGSGLQQPAEGRHWQRPRDPRCEGPPPPPWPRCVRIGVLLQTSAVLGQRLSEPPLSRRPDRPGARRRLPAADRRRARPERQRRPSECARITAPPGSAWPDMPLPWRSRDGAPDRPATPTERPPHLPRGSGPGPARPRHPRSWAALAHLLQCFASFERAAGFEEEPRHPVAEVVKAGPQLQRGLILLDGPAQRARLPA